MSLLDALLRDSLLNPPVMQQNYYISIRSDGVPGAGTIDDPFNGSTQPLFDAAFASIPANSTIILGPCPFSENEMHGWVVEKPFLSNGLTLKNGQRLVGAGADVTVIKLNSSPPNAFKAAISSGFLSGGAEISDVQIDANLPAASGMNSYSAGGININGVNILVKRVRVTKAGSNSSSLPATAICVASADTVGQVPVNCVVDSCMVEAPNANHTETLVGIGLKAAPTAGTMNYHENCVIRCCYVDLGYDPLSPTTLIGVSAVGCAGTII
jgi:hypothetical protein